MAVEGPEDEQAEVKHLRFLYVGMFVFTLIDRVWCLTDEII